jgi:glycyl-tRNA synthetase alpha chain
MLTFQQIILPARLLGRQGCALLQPYDMEVGAGTFHTATFLRAIGPEPWAPPTCSPRAAPRMAAMAKPQPPAALLPVPGGAEAGAGKHPGAVPGFAGSAGLDLKQNDVRFVEDDWENPTLGAWGLGWEVWLNGMEVTQFTYFQQVGGIDCKPVPARSPTASSAWPCTCRAWKTSTTWSGPMDRDGRSLTYGDVFHQNEVEQSTYNFEHSNVDFLFSLFANYEAEAKRLMKCRWRCRPTSRCSRPPTPSTCWTRAAPSR